MAMYFRKLRHIKRNKQLPETGVESRPPERVYRSIVSVNTIGTKIGTANEFRHYAIGY